MRMQTFRAFNFLDSFLTAALAIMVPLALEAKGIDIVSIGGIIAFMPLFFTVSRTIFASVADGIGTRPFFIFNAAANTAAPLLYMNATSTSAYVSGRVLEGLRGGAIWSVNRLEAARLSVQRSLEKELAGLMGLRILAFAVGTIGAGYLAETLGFNGGFIFLSAVAGVSFLMSFGIGSGGFRVENVRKIADRLDLRKKTKEMFRSMLILIPGLPATTIPLSFLFPLYFNSIGFDYAAIGGLLAMYYIMSAATVHTTLRMNMKFRDMCIYGAFMFAVGTGLLVFEQSAYLAMLVMGMGDGFSSIIWEAVLVRGLGHAKNAATDIGLMHVPAHAITAILLAVAGGIVVIYGFIAAFAMCAFLMALFFFLARREI